MLVFTIISCIVTNRAQEAAMYCYVIMPSCQHTITTTMKVDRRFYQCSYDQYRDRISLQPYIRVLLFLINFDDRTQPSLHDG